MTDAEQNTSTDVVVEVQKKPAKIWPYPGDINVSSVDGRNFSGCKAVVFKDADHFNEFFSENGPAQLGLLVDWRIGKDGEILTLWTRQLSPEEQSDFTEVSMEVEAAMRERREKRAERKVVEEKTIAEGAKEDRRLIQVGKDYEKRVANVKSLPPGKDRKALEKKLNAGVYMRLDAQVEVLSLILDAPTDKLVEDKEIVAVFNGVLASKRAERNEMLTVPTEEEAKDATE